MLTEWLPEPGEQGAKAAAAPVGVRLQRTPGGPVVASEDVKVQVWVPPGPNVWLSGPLTVSAGAELSIVTATPVESAWSPSWLVARATTVAAPSASVAVFTDTE